MKRKEEIKEMATTTASHITSDKDMQVAFADVLRRGAEWADRTMIEKACEWLYEYNRKQADKMFGTVHTADVTINVAEFRKAMESGSSEIPNKCEKGGEE